ncbi:MAG: hypothetical protein RJP95_01840 [Pirellulales bacterium]
MLFIVPQAVQASDRLAILGAFGGEPLIKTDRPNENPWKRSGHPQRISWLARPSNTPKYYGDYVGGGTAIGGDPRTLQEGTWGWDYDGYVFPARIWLQWSHGRRYQGGTGAYKTEGPHILH